MKNVTGNAPDLVQLLPEQTGYDRQEWYGFTNPEAIADYIERRNKRDAWQTYAWDIEDEFSGPDMLKTFDLCRNGWKEGAERVNRLRDKIRAARPMGPRMVKYDVAGACPSVPRALAGNPLNMRRVDSARLRRRPVLNLVINIGGLSEVPRDCFVNRAAVVAAVVDEIENAGFSVSVTALSQSTASKHLCGVVFSLKDAGAQADVARLAFGAGHVGMFRRMVFAIRELHHANQVLGTGLGQTIELSKPEADTFVLPSLNQCSALFKSEELAATKGLAWVVETLRKQGCPAFPQEEPAAA